MPRLPGVLVGSGPAPRGYESCADEDCWDGQSHFHRYEPTPRPRPRPLEDVVTGGKIEPGRGVVPVYSCGCTDHPPDAVFYTSARNDSGRYVALSGPYPSHTEALAHVREDQRWANDESGDPRACWYAYGTFAALRENTIRPARGGPGYVLKQAP